MNKREKEIELVEEKIENIKEKAKDDEGEIKIRIGELTHTKDEIEAKINSVKQELRGIETRKKQQIAEIWSELGLPQPKASVPITTTKVHRPTSKVTYRDSYREQLNPGRIQESYRARHILYKHRKDC